MRRTFVALLVAVAAPALADPKPTLAIVAIDGDDPPSAKPADAVTEALRAEASGKSRYTPKGSAKETWAAQLKAECKPLVPACSIAIGTAVGADYVLAGELETRGGHRVLTLG